MNEKKDIKRKGMASLMHDGVEHLLQRKGRAQPETGTSRRVAMSVNHVREEGRARPRGQGESDRQTRPGNQNGWVT